MNLINIILPLVGVALGGMIGLLSPLVSYFIDKRKRKNQIQSEIIYLVYVRLGLLTNYVRTTNWRSIRLAMARYLDSQLHAANSTLNAAKVASNEVAKKEIVLKVHEGTEKLETLHEKVSETEAKLMSILFESDSVFGGEIYKSLSTLIRNYISTGSQPESVQVADYTNLNGPQLKVEEKLLPEKIITRTKEFQEAANSFVGELKEIF